jgi:hypothetical protein
MATRSITTLGDGKLNKNNKIEKMEQDSVEPDFHEAAVINEKGEEIAITEDMVRDAILKLDQEADTDSGQASDQKDSS